MDTVPHNGAAPGAQPGSASVIIANKILITQECGVSPHQAPSQAPVELNPSQSIVTLPATATGQPTL